MILRKWWIKCYSHCSAWVWILASWASISLQLWLASTQLFLFASEYPKTSKQESPTCIHGDGQKDPTGGETFPCVWVVSVVADVVVSRACTLHIYERLDAQSSLNHRVAENRDSYLNENSFPASRKQTVIVMVTMIILASSFLSVLLRLTFQTAINLYKTDPTYIKLIQTIDITNHKRVNTAQ